MQYGATWYMSLGRRFSSQGGSFTRYRMRAVPKPI
jgi:hypothetical protein